MDLDKKFVICLVLSIAVNTVSTYLVTGWLVKVDEMIDGLARNQAEWRKQMYWERCVKDDNK